MKKIIIIGISLILLYFLIISKPVEVAWWCTMSFINPHLNEIFEKKYASFSNEKLLKELRSYSENARGYASSELVSRKDKSLTPVFNKMLNSNRKNEKWTAIYALVEMNDQSAIPVLLKEVKSTNFDDHIEAVRMLSKLRYEPIIPEIKKLSEMLITEKYGEIPKNNAVRMAGYFGNNPQTIQILKNIAADKSTILAWKQAEDMLKKINGK